MKKRWYIGHQTGTGIRTPFQATETPTQESHGHLYGWANGPFRTKRAAFWACQYGAHWSTIAEAERAAKAEAIIGQVAEVITSQVGEAIIGQAQGRFRDNPGAPLRQRKWQIFNREAK